MPYINRTWRALLLGNTYDSNAAAYFAAAGITNPQERAAVNTFIIGMKAAGLWNKMARIWPVSPTSLSAALIDCKALTTMTAFNSPTFSTNGITFDGISQYLDTNTAPSAAAPLSQDSASIAIYNRTASPTSASFAAVFMGTNNGTSALQIYDLLAGPNAAIDTNDLTTTSTFTVGAGLLQTSRTSSTAGFYSLNGGNSAWTVTSTGVPTMNMLIAAQNASGTPSFFGGYNFAYASMGSSLSTADALTHYNLVQTYQTTVIAGGRQV